MGNHPAPPRSPQMLSRWADAYARQIGQDVARVRRWISFMALGGSLEQAGFDGAGPKFSVKGGVALELRLPGRARATKDMDLVVNHPEVDLLEALEAVLHKECEGFTFRRRGEPQRLPNGAVRSDVAVQYGGSTWGRIQVDIGRMEGSGEVEVEMVDGLDLSFFHFNFPERIPCLSLYAQAAQKIHGLTLPSRPGWQNERFKDLVDLLLIEELIHDREALRSACEHLFALRNTHTWPPFVEAPPNWAEPFRRMADEVDLPIKDVRQAVYRIRGLLHEIEPSTRLFDVMEVEQNVTATNWYYALGADARPYRVPVAIAEGLILRRTDALNGVKPAWYRDPGGVVLVEVLVFLHNGAPVFVGGTVFHQIAVNANASAITPVVQQEVWEGLAVEIVRRAKASTASGSTLARFLAIGERISAVTIAALTGVTVRGAYSYIASAFNSGNWDSPVWSFAADDLVIPQVQ